MSNLKLNSQHASVHVYGPTAVLNHLNVTVNRDEEFTIDLNGLPDLPDDSTPSPTSYVLQPDEWPAVTDLIVKLHTTALGYNDTDIALSQPVATPDEAYRVRDLFLKLARENLLNTDALRMGTESFWRVTIWGLGDETGYIPVEQTSVHF